MDNRTGIVFERIDGPEMFDYLEDYPEELENCARHILMWLPDFLKEPGTPEPDKLLTIFLKQYADAFCQHYEKLRPIDQKSFISWQMVAAAVGLVWDGGVVPDDRRITFIKVILNGTDHPWL